MPAMTLMVGFPTVVAAILLPPVARPAAYAAFALRVQPDLTRTANAFAFPPMPISALWRLIAAAAALRMVANTLDPDAAPLRSTTETKQ
jgi:hypothetical protein